MIALLVAFYFSVMIPGFDHPTLVGPYETYDACDDDLREVMVWEWDVSKCGLMPFPQDSVSLQFTTFKLYKQPGSRQLDNRYRQ